MPFQNSKIIATEANPTAYHDQPEARGSKEFVISSSSLREFARCPSRWRDGYTAPHSDAKADGSLFDCLLLTPKQFNQRFKIRPATYQNEDGDVKPWNSNAKVCRKWIEDHDAFEVITEAEFKEAMEAIAVFEKDPVLKAFLQASQTQVHITAQWHDEATGLVIPVQALLDLMPAADSEFGKCIGDVKRTRNAGIGSWRRWCFQAGLYIQAAFYTDLLTAAEGEGSDRNSFCFLLSENFKPWQSAKRLLSQDFLELGRADYRRHLANYCQCVKHDRWPTYDDHDEAIQGWTPVTPEPWMATEEQFAPHFEFEEATQEQEENVDLIL